MASVNKVIIIGYLGADPETRYLPSGDAVTNIRVATSEKWKDKSGEQQEHTEWHRINFFGKRAEAAGEYLKKGDPVYIEGRIRTRKWQDKETGQDKYSTEIVADNLQFLTKKEDSGGGGGRSGGKDYGEGKGRGDRQQGGAQGSKPAAAKKGGGGAFDQMDDDIPFAPIGRGISGHAI